MSWTPPFYGVQHLEHLPKGHQITLVKYDTFVEAYHLFNSFTPIAEDDFETVDEAMRWGEQQASLFHIKKEVPFERP